MGVDHIPGSRALLTRVDGCHLHVILKIEEFWIWEKERKYGRV